ncbi:hypothetical protein F5Y10DRAFT_231194 [Nemania abortiva]|nr:hypothetical protein F5Y10DRAFT_231194 [Nemania abortiva]
MVTDDASAEGFGATVIADISALVARRLREKHLYSFICSRDALLRLQRPSDPEAIQQFHVRSLRDLEETWHSELQILRSELPKALDQVFDNLKPEFQAMGRSSSPENDTPTTMLPELTEAPVASTSINPTPKIRIRPSLLSIKEDERPDPEIKSVDNMPKSVDKHSNKRPSGLISPATSQPQKKTKKTYESPIKKTIYGYDLDDEESIFTYGGYSGVYVLRCNQVQCKKRLYQDGPTIFRSHPFENNVALDHFGGAPHKMDSEPEIFRKFAIRVLDADSDRNYKKTNAPKPGSSLLDGDLASQPASQPTSPSKAKDKGKKPEWPYNLSSLRTMAAEASTLAPAANIAEAVGDSINIASPRSDDSGELPPLEHIVKQNTDRATNTIHTSHCGTFPK